MYKINRMSSKEIKQDIICSVTLKKVYTYNNKGVCYKHLYVLTCLHFGDSKVL